MHGTSRERIAAALAEMPAFNHHDHGWQAFDPAYAVELDLPAFLVKGGLASSLVSAGLTLPDDAFSYLSDPSVPDGAERVWALLRPYLDRVRTTIAFRYLLRALEDLYGVREDDVFSDGWREAPERIRPYSRAHRGQGAALYRRMGVVATVLDAKIGLERLVDINPPDHRVLHVVRLDRFIHEERGLAETLAQHPAANWDGWLAAFDRAFHQALDAGAVGFKSGLAYNRPIAYGDPPEDAVARIFRRGLLAASQGDKTAYQDFMMNRLCRLCAVADVPLQIHTGIQAGNRHTLENTRPTLLTSLFQRHGDLRVDLFHGGYPWVVEAGLMAAQFPNVYVDGCWLPQLSPSAYRAALTSWIESVPASKIFAWGSDTNAPEHAYASLLLTKDLLADVLADLVDGGYFYLDLALELAERILYRNGLAFWRLDSDSGAAGSAS